MMKRFNLLVCLLAVTALSCSRARESCPVCQREECKGFAFRVTLADGKTVSACCPRCGLQYLRSSNQQARALTATDFSTGQWIDATKAVYVSGSDVSHCAMNETRRDAYGCCYFKGYDRCEPSLIAFASKEQAESFLKQHGGKLLGYDNLLAQ